MGGLETFKSDSSGSDDDPSLEQDFEENDQFIPRGSYFDRSIELEHILELPNESGSEADDQMNYDGMNHEFQNYGHSSESDEENLRHNDFFQKGVRFR